MNAQRFPEKAYVAIPAEWSPIPNRTLGRCCVCDRKVQLWRKAVEAPALPSICVECIAAYEPED